MRMTTVAATIVTAMLLTLTGCRTEPKISPDANFPTRQTYNVSPKVLIEKIKPVIGLSITSEQEGRLVTDWEPHTGARFGLLFIGRTWQERTRYTITVSPAWDDPNKSTIEVTEETQQRSQPNYDWDFEPTVKRPDRAAAMSKKIDMALSSAPK